MTKYWIEWPERRVATADVIRGWAEDAISNGEIKGPATLSTEDLFSQLNTEGLITGSIIDPNDDLNPEDRVHQMIEEAARHSGDCQCTICFMGADAWLWNFHPGEY